MRYVVFFDGTTPTWGAFDDAVFVELPTDDPEEVDDMLRELAESRGTVLSSVEHVVFERPAE